MKFTLATLTTLVAPIIAQNQPQRTFDSSFTHATPTGSVTQPPTWYPSDLPPPPLAPTDSVKWSSIYASLVSAGKIPSTLTAAPWPTGQYGPGQGPYGGPGGPGGRPGPGGPGGPGHFGGPGGPGPFGSSNWGPFSEWSTRSDWRTAPWTAWWDGSACPSSDWPGWTAGPWSTAPPWTSWAGCTAKTTATTVSTATVNGTATVATGYGLQVLAASTDGAAASPTLKQGAGAQVTVGMGTVMGAAFGAAVLGLAVGL